MWVRDLAVLAAALAVGWTAVEEMLRRGSLRPVWLGSAALTVADVAVALTAWAIAMEFSGGEGADFRGWGFAAAWIAAWVFARMWLVLGSEGLAAWVRARAAGRTRELRLEWSPALCVFGGSLTVIALLFIGFAVAVGAVLTAVDRAVADIAVVVLLAVYGRCHLRGQARFAEAVTAAPPCACATCGEDVR